MCNFFRIFNKLYYFMYMIYTQKSMCIYKICSSFLTSIIKFTYSLCIEIVITVDFYVDF
jgi:hypothetical protein